MRDTNCSQSQRTKAIAHRKNRRSESPAQARDVAH